jgi:uncharacterized membrane protein YeiH
VAPVPQIVLALGDKPVVSAGFDATLILWLNLVGTFVFGLSGAIAAVRARFDLFGVVTLSAVVALAGGVTRDVLIGVPPATFRDWRYLVAVGAAGLIGFVARPALDRVQRTILVFDAIGLSVFCVTGASKAIDYGLGPLQATILGAITGIGGGLLRDVLLQEAPVVFTHELYAIPALVGAAIVAIAHEAGSTSGWFTILGAATCLGVRLIGLRLGLNLPVAPSERDPRPSG